MVSKTGLLRKFPLQMKRVRKEHANSIRLSLKRAYIETSSLRIKHHDNKVNVRDVITVLFLDNRQDNMVSVHLSKIIITVNINNFLSSGKQNIYPFA